MPIDKKTLNEFIGKQVVTKEGKRLGITQDITFETKSGELIQVVLRNPTPHAKNFNLERTSNNELLLPFNSIIAVGDFIVVSEEDLV